MLRLAPLGAAALALAACGTPERPMSRPPIASATEGAWNQSPSLPPARTAAARTDPAPAASKPEPSKFDPKIETVDVVVDTATGVGRDRLVSYLLSERWTLVRRTEEGTKVTWSFMRIKFDEVEIDPLRLVPIPGKP